MDEPLQPINPTNPLSPGRKSMNSEALKMGLMMAGLMIVYALVLHFAGLATNRNLGWIVYALVFAGLYLGVKNYRDTQLNGFMSFGAAFSMGFRILLYAGLIYAIYTYIYFKTFGHDTMKDLLVTVENELAQQEQVSESQAEQMIDMYRNYVFIPGTLAIMSFLGTLFIGCILSLINAAILKRPTEALEPPMP